MSQPIHLMKPRSHNRSEEFKRDGRKAHNWKKTSRTIDGGRIHFHACTDCKPAHMVAYNFEPYVRQA